MLIKDIQQCSEIVGFDGSCIRELLHADEVGGQIRYSIAHAELPVGKTALLHRLTTSEVYFILRGQGKMRIEDEWVPVHPDQVIYIPPQSRQALMNTGSEPLCFLCIVDPPWCAENEQVLE